MRLFHKHAIIILLAVIWVSVSWAGVEYPDVSEDGDVDLFINFTSGSKIVNESPKVRAPIADVVVISGQGDSLLAVLTQVFHDYENGKELSFSARNSDTSLVKLRFNRADSSVTARFSSEKTGRADIRVTASDGVLRTTDTFSITIKERFTLKDTVPDLFVEKRDRNSIELDLSDFIRKKDEGYQFTTYSDDSITILNSSSQTVTLVPDTKELGAYNLTINITAPDSQRVTDHFTLTVTERKSYSVNSGFTIFTGYNYSGAGVQLLFKERLSVGITGYGHWDRDGVGGNVKFSYRFLRQYMISPYMLLFGGYHRQTIEDNTGVGDRELSLITGGAGAGAELKLGRTGRHAFSLETGYCYGVGEYSVAATTAFGSHEVSIESETFSLPPIYIEFAYTIYLRKRVRE